MGRILAIDFGKKRIGLAVTDPLRIIATPLETVTAGELESFISDYLSKEEVDEFVVGYPRRMNNQPSEIVKYLEPFLKRLAGLYPGKPINLVDERFTSKIARKAMLEGGLKKQDRQDKATADRISASLILQSFLEKREKTIHLRQS
jgi:putative Holliday junction resolvase